MAKLILFVILALTAAGIYGGDSGWRGSTPRPSVKPTLATAPTSLNWGGWGNGNSYASGCDFPGNDFLIVNTANADLCAAKCLFTFACTHFTWSNGKCFVKDGHVTRDTASKYSDQKVICGIIGSNVIWNDWGNGNSYASGCDFPGNDIATVITTDQNVCAAQCISNAQCNHMTWNSGGNCFLKSLQTISKTNVVNLSDQKTFCGIYPK